MSSPWLGYPMFSWPAAPFGLLYCFSAGSSTPKSTYSDKDNTVPNINPVQLDASGTATVRLGAGSYKFVLLDQTNTVTLFTADFYDSPLVFYEQTAGEANVGVTPTNSLYPPGNVLRYGVVPNSAGDGLRNAAALKALISYKAHVTGWTGTLVFPNTTGKDVYYINDYLDFRPGIDVDLQFCTLSFTKLFDATDVNSGFISAIRNFSIKNGTINVIFNCANGGHGLMFGARGADGTYFTPLYDSTLTDEFGAATTMGNIKVTNLKISSINTNNRCIFMFGGLQNVSFENVWMEGNGAADGCYYEFGWATDAGGVLASRQTSHAKNISFKNIKATNLSTFGGLGAIVCNGAYNWSVDGLFVSVATSCLSAGTGEAWFYNPWNGNDDGRVTKRTATFKNIIGKGITSIGIGVQGSNTGSTLSGGFLKDTINALSTPNRWSVLTDLVSASIDGFAMNGTSGNHGIMVTGADHVEISNGRLVGFQNGIRTTDETTHYHIKNVKIFDSTAAGMAIGNGSDVWSPARQSIGVIEGCFIAGSGTAGTSAAIAINNSYAVHIRNNRFGYEVAHDGSAESTQAQAVTVATNGFGVICDNNYVAATSGGAVAYNLAASANSRGCAILNPRGLATIQGLWNGVRVSGNIGLTYSAAMTPDASSIRNFITVTNGTAFTINAPANTPATLGQQLIICIRNTSGGAAGVATWNAIYKMSTWTQPATANNRSITFDYDGTNWVQSSQTGVDIPN